MSYITLLRRKNWLIVGVSLFLALAVGALLSSMLDKGLSGRAFFALFGVVFLIPAIVIVRLFPRWILWGTIALAAVYSPAVTAFGNQFGTYVTMIVGALGLASVFVELADRKQPTSLVTVWSRAGITARFLTATLLFLLALATLYTLSGSLPAAGTAVNLLGWSTALLSVRRVVAQRPSVLPKLMLTSALLATGVILSFYPITGSLGLLDTVLGMLSISMLALSWQLGTRGLKTALWLIGATLALFLIYWLFSRSQSVLVGFLFGASCMILTKIWLRARLARSEQFWTVLVVAGILAGPLSSELLYYGRSSDLLQAPISMVLNLSGESERNLLDRPRRWEALFRDIAREPFRLQFTDFLDTEYYAEGNVWLPAFPHNIIIATGRWIGVPGMLTFSALLVLLIIRSIRLVSLTQGSQFQGTALIFLGVITALVWRNMWSAMLFVNPLEWVFFALAVYGSLILGTPTMRMASLPFSPRTRIPRS